VNIDEIETWFVKCSCGACGFTQEDTELSGTDHKGMGLAVHEVPNSVGTFVHLADPLPIFINEMGTWIYVFWYKKDDRHYV